jgi:hypothetical protein
MRFYVAAIPESEHTMTALFYGTMVTILIYLAYLVHTVFAKEDESQ